MSLDHRFPALDDIRRRARRRLPRFVWEYLDSGTGDETAMPRAMAALDAITLVPRALGGAPKPDLSVRMMGRDYPLPFGFAPVGMSGLVWPDAEVTLARSAARHHIPFGLSTVAAQTPEHLAPHIGDQGWFQLYAPGQPEIRRDMLARARDSGFHTLILTADVPVPSRRERLHRAGVTNPMRMTPRILAQAAMHPAWALATLRSGIPTLKTLEKYGDTRTSRSGTEHIGYQLRTAPDWAYLETLRREWDGALVVKGVLHPGDAARISKIADAVWVSGHGGRQFDAGPAPATVLPAIRAAVGPSFPVIADGAVRAGTDILRLMAMGADFVMLGRAPHWGLAAFGAAGVDHVVHVLRAGLIADMGQLGLGRLVAGLDQTAG
ncbi:alpha-hydroxy acid oxidase [Oceaniglobus trochenteri]|uniref:alpha-hydroxy acid oxidase n=1 Tax=Oceaniglobus trochenteri TaxID=2763260 RepID=UPI001CFF6694|nr:alpha-hydroxy acid oxidase [Oceaniglobus trochenteri]